MMLPRRLLLPIVLLAAGALLVACNPGPNPSIVLGAGGPPPAGVSGDSMHRLASNPGKWSAGKKAKRRCDGGLGCWLGTKKVEIELFADTGAMNYGPSTSSTPVLVGKLVNLGNAKAEMYGLDNGGYNYLLWVVPGGVADTGQFIIVQVDTVPPHNSRTVASGRQIGCGHNKTWTASFAVFISCADAPPPPPGTVRGDPPKASLHIRRAGFFSFFTILTKFMGGEDPAWFTCTSGCCTAGEPQ